MTDCRVTHLGLVAAWTLSAICPALAGDWPQWRGPTGDSVSRETRLPAEWSEQAGIVWKTALPEWGTSTPAIWGDAIFVTAHADDRLLLVRLDKRSGRVEWTRQVGSGEARRAPAQKNASPRGEQKFHRLQNLASPSPVTNGQLVVVHYGNGDLAAFDFAGKQRWRRNLQDDHGKYTIWWGHANSPVLYGDLVISVCMQDSLADLGGPIAASYVVAHDLATGAERWKTPRMTPAEAEQCDAYTTPVFRRTEGRTELVIMGGNQVDAYSPETGKPLWALAGLTGGRTVTGPTLAHGLVFVTRGMKGPLLAVSPAHEGPLDQSAIAWTHEQGTPDSCCPVVWQDLLYLVSDHGVAQCLDARSGAVQWQERLGGDFKASPLAADGRIYFLNTSGRCTVVTAGRRFEKLAENKLDDETIASPAVSDGHIYVRGRRWLYCIGQVASSKPAGNNPKSEIRNPKESETRKAQTRISDFLRIPHFCFPSDFGSPSDFGFRIFPCGC
jgi:outer membrane protein assembly factor BamB